MSVERQHRNGRQVFICHAGSDKETVARPLARTLSTLGVSVWLDADQLRIGDRVRPAIDAALACCGSAVVIFSPEFYRCRWAAEYEFDGIVSRFVSAQLLLLPILHNLGRAEFRLREPSLGSCVSRSTSEFVIGDIAKEIAEVVLTRDRWPLRPGTAPHARRATRLPVVRRTNPLDGFMPPRRPSPVGVPTRRAPAHLRWVSCG